MVNGNPQAKVSGEGAVCAIAELAYNAIRICPRAHGKFCRSRCGEICHLIAQGKAPADHRHYPARRASKPVRHAHAHGGYAQRRRRQRVAHRACSASRCGWGYVDTAMFPQRIRQRLRQLREAAPNICFQMLFRGPTPWYRIIRTTRRRSRYLPRMAWIAPNFRLLNYPPNLKAAMEV